MRLNFLFLSIPALFAVMAPDVAFAQNADLGKQVYESVCTVCHQPDGKGLVGVAPPIADALGPYLKSETGQNYLMSVLVIGLNGKITINGGESFNGVMPPHGHLSDQELADVATYIAVKLNGKANHAFSTADFQNARNSKTTHKQLREIRRKLIND